MTKGETFLWRTVDDKLQIGVAYLWKQSAFRGLANYILIPQKGEMPNLRVGLGLQGIATGNPGYFATSEKVWTSGKNDYSIYAGIGFRANENHGHLVGGGKVTPNHGTWTIGVQLDGHNKHPFVNQRVSPNLAIGAYWIEMKSLGVMISLSK